MKNLLEQPELDLSGETVESRWNLMEQQEAVNWTDEALCIAWCWPKSDWRAHKEWWDNLPKYEQRHLLDLWRYDRHEVPKGSSPLSLESCIAREGNSLKNAEELAKHWAIEIRAAAKRGQPVPIRPAPGLEYILDWACDLAGLLVVRAS